VLSALDLDGRVGIDYGVYGVPETYVIDKAGIIRMKHTGPITPDVLAKKIMPLLAELANDAVVALLLAVRWYRRFPSPLSGARSRTAGRRSGRRKAPASTVRGIALPGLPERTLADSNAELAKSICAAKSAA
jgi:hypothetical protein